jgi:hypothetical protein
MNPVGARQRRRDATPSRPRASAIDITRVFEPDLQRQVAALLVLLDVRPNVERRGQPRQATAETTEGR